MTPFAALHKSSQECLHFNNPMNTLITCIVRIGFSITGPLPGTMSKGMPMPARGVRMSEKRMTPSGWKARHGCSEISVASAAFSDRSRNERWREHRSMYDWEAVVMER